MEEICITGEMDWQERKLLNHMESVPAFAAASLQERISLLSVSVLYLIITAYRVKNDPGKGADKNGRQVRQIRGFEAQGSAAQKPDGKKTPAKAIGC
jgi:hypothetical protein